MRDRAGRLAGQAAPSAPGQSGRGSGQPEPRFVGGHQLIQITPQMRILVAIESVDGRRGMDSLAQLCRETLRSDPFSGCLFIFRNRSAKAIRILAFDGQGFWLGTKRLSEGSL